MNDCQIQTDNSIDSKESMSETRAIELEKLHERLANIEGIIEQKENNLRHIEEINDDL